MSISQRFLRAADIIGCQLLGRFFVGGHSIEEVLKRGADLKRDGYKVTYNLLGEHVDDPVIVDYALLTTVKLISAMDDTNRGNISIKPTLYGLQISSEHFYRIAESIIDHAKRAGIEVEFDAEDRRFIPDTLETFRAFASKFHYRGFVRQAVQAHLVDILDLMDDYDLWDKQLRVVKGSGVYPELSGITIEDSERVLGQYYHIARRNHIKGQVPYIATVRDKNLAEKIRRVLPSRFMYAFQMLYNRLPFGMFGRRLGEKLLKNGYEVRIYIPFVVDWCKDEWKAYGLRRSEMMRRLIWEEILGGLEHPHLFPETPVWLPPY